MSEYDIVYITHKAVKGSAIANHLANNVIDNYESLKFDFPYEDVMALSEGIYDEESDDKWKIYFDRSVNLSGKGIGVVIVSPKGK